MFYLLGLSLLLVSLAVLTFFVKNRVTDDEVPSLMQQQFTESGTAYISKGEGSALVLVHGFLGSKSSFSLVMDDLSKNYRVFALDVIGFGYTRPVESYSREAIVSQLERFFSELGIEQATVVGHSMGGSIAQGFAAWHPDKVKELIVVNSSNLFECESNNAKNVSPKPSPVGRAFADPSGRKILKAIFGKVLVRTILKKLYAPNIKLNETVVAEYAYPLTQESFWNNFPKFLKGTAKDWVERTRIKVDENKQLKVNAIWGELDTLTPIAKAECFRNIYPNFSLHRLSGVGHVPMEEAPGKFLRAFSEAVSSKK